jgi:hypothetical protein
MSGQLFGFVRIWWRSDGKIPAMEISCHCQPRTNKPSHDTEQSNGAGFTKRDKREGRAVHQQPSRKVADL